MSRWEMLRLAEWKLMFCLSTCLLGRCLSLLYRIVTANFPSACKLSLTKCSSRIFNITCAYEYTWWWSVAVLEDRRYLSLCSCIPEQKSLGTRLRRIQRGLREWNGRDITCFQSLRYTCNLFHHVLSQVNIHDWEAHAQTVQVANPGTSYSWCAVI